MDCFKGKSTVNIRKPLVLGSKLSKSYRLPAGLIDLGSARYKVRLQSFLARHSSQALSPCSILKLRRNGKVKVGETAILPQQLPQLVESFRWHQVWVRLKSRAQSSVCVWNIWTDVKLLLLFSFAGGCRAQWKLHPTKLSTCAGSRVWSTLCTCDFNQFCDTLHSDHG